MSGARYARAVMARALTVACVVLLCVFGAGPAAATAADSRTATAPTAPVEPGESPSDPAADLEARAAVRMPVRGVPGPRRLPRAVFHVKHAGGPERAVSYGTAGPVPSGRTVMSVVLRC
ncbi:MULTISPECIES: hypothetical protein [unclassified Streptomyces]|uniref:hypothetical protein n=1 Tax=unclassified Streptomyces TaxID=2593676 RepID=UPI001BE608F7|nr:MULTISPECIES: hypothetical protein [unclassified Streptomyces]MBT2407969.1 hypothetical protein [Streptomyces sp. ISL-21]MBT2457667.1 hypothetical protein [Streptomyces sp. ISL-86]MBT2610536.1 hypothetical protein [Streptomyces sp. ISL-87]